MTNAEPLRVDFSRSPGTSFLQLLQDLDRATVTLDLGLIQRCVQPKPLPVHWISANRRANNFEKFIGLSEDNVRQVSGGSSEGPRTPGQWSHFSASPDGSAATCISIFLRAQEQDEGFDDDPYTRENERQVLLVCFSACSMDTGRFGAFDEPLIVLRSRTKIVHMRAETTHYQERGLVAFSAHVVFSEGLDEKKTWYDFGRVLDISQMLVAPEVPDSESSSPALQIPRHFSRPSSKLENTPTLTLSAIAALGMS